MAKIINLTLEGVQVYPQTITDAIADIDSKKKLSTILKELKSEQAKKYSLVADEEKALTYHLVDGDGVSCGTINIPQDTFLDSVSVTENDELEFVFNTASGKETIKCDISKYIDTYEAGNGISLSSNKKFSVKVVENKFVKVTENGVEVVEGNITTGTEGIADAKAVKEFVESAIATEDSAVKSFVADSIAEAIDKEDASIKKFVADSIATEDATIKTFVGEAITKEDSSIVSYVNTRLDGAVYGVVMGDDEYLDIAVILGTTVSTEATLNNVMNSKKDAKAVLTANMTPTEPIVIDVDEDEEVYSANAYGDKQYARTITLDLNGHSITYTGAGYFLNIRNPKVNVILKNGTITTNGRLALVANGSSLVIESGEYTSVNDIALSAEGASYITVNGGKINSVEGAIATLKACGAHIIVNGGELSASDNGVIMGNGSNREGEPNTIEILGGTLNGSIKSSGYIACGVYAPWKDNIVIDNVTMNITNGCGVCARAGMITLGSNVTINTSGTVLGKVGDSRVVVPCAPIVFDEAANYPGITADSKVKVASVEHMTTESDGVLATVVKENEVDVTKYGASLRIVLG